MEILEFDKSGKERGKSFKPLWEMCRYGDVIVVTLSGQLTSADPSPCHQHTQWSCSHTHPVCITLTVVVNFDSRDAFELMLGSVSDNGHSLEDCKTYLTTPTSTDGRRPVDFTDGFIDFKRFCDDSDIPFTIVSRYDFMFMSSLSFFPTRTHRRGMDELIRAVLTELAKGFDKDVVKDISIVSNGVRRNATGKWFVTWRHPESAYGHDKSRAILPYRDYRRDHDGQGPTVFFFGDGVSDLSAAQHADVLFVKVTGIDEKDNLKKHCDKAGIPYIPFLDFRIAKAIVGQIVRGEKTKDEFLVKPSVSMN
ncbi:HAD-like domain-containing protein [Lanmaoa asiatica]|nr:HAD-like domain-containing protein [Lanmaoa asiatica]